MILRTWRGRTRVEVGDEYERFLEERALPDYSGTPGFTGATFSRRDEGGIAHFLLCTTWTDMDAVHRFAGADAARAKYYPEDERYLLEQDASADNHRVFAETS